MGSTTTRTVRFKADELKKIDRFLKMNPVFDFSTLTRVALLEYISNPTLKLQAIQSDKNKTANNTSPSKGVSV